MVSLPTAGTDIFFGWGLIAHKFEGVATGLLPSAALNYVPLPFYDADSDWIYTWHQTIAGGAAVFQAVDATIQGTGQEDIRTKRKFQNGMGLLGVAYFETSSASGSIKFALSGRLLFLN